MAIVAEVTAGECILPRRIQKTKPSTLVQNQLEARTRKSLVGLALGETKYRCTAMNTFGDLFTDRQLVALTHNLL